jgi:hypothetical protein
MSRAILTLMTVAALIFSAAPAQAEVAGHCSYRLVPIERVGAVVNADLERIGCFGTFSEAVQAGLGIDVGFDATITPQSITHEAVDQLATSSVMIGTEYDGFSFSGASTSYFAATTCTASTTWQVANVGAGWNDRFQSGKGFGGCNTNRKFQHENFGGTVKVCTPNCTDYGAVANQVTSLRWRD